MIKAGSRTPIVLAATVLFCGLSACSDSDNDNDGNGNDARGDTLALTESNNLISFDRAAPGTVLSTVPITGLTADESLVGFDIRPFNGLLYAVGSEGQLYTIDIASGAATAGTTLDQALDGDTFGVDFNPVPDRLRIVSDTGQNLRVNVDTGAVTVDGPLTILGAPATGITAVAYTNSFGAACRTALFYIDTGTGRLLTTSAPNDGILTAVSTAAGARDPMSAFEIATGADGSNVAFAALATDAGPTLSRLDLMSGVLSGGEQIGGSALAGETIKGLAMAPPATVPTQAVGGVLGLSTGNKIVSFNQASPAKLCTSFAITNVPTGEDVVGIDVRPSNQMLYALTEGGALLTVDPATGVGDPATGLDSTPVTLTDDPADTAAFTRLDGANFGVDFNPVPDRLRVVSDTGQNLRIDVETGLVTIDIPLSNTIAGEARAGITGAAYTNSAAGAVTATMLYYLDSNTDSLLSTTAPNDGVVTSVGPLGANVEPDVGVVNGFDIDGRTNTALIGVNAAGAMGTSIHTVNLATGTAAAPLGVVGGGEALRGLSVVVPPAP